MKKAISLMIILSIFMTGVGSYFLGNENSKKYIIKINGEQIHQDQFDQAFQKEKYFFLKNMHQEFLWKDHDQDLENFIRVQVLNKLIQETLLSQYSMKLGIKVSEDKIKEEIRNLSIFQENGKFDKRKYKSFLLRNQISGKTLSQEIKKNFLTKKVMQSYFLDEFLLPSESLEYAKFMFQKRKIQTLTLPILQYQKLQNVSEEEMEAYYQNYPDQFLSSRKARISYIKLDIESQYENLNLKEEEFEFYKKNKKFFTNPPKNYYSMIQLDSIKDAELMIEKLSQGFSFEELAKKFSTDPFSAKKNGSIGWIEKEFLPQVIVSANLKKIGQISKIIEFEGKYLIFRLDRSINKSYKTFLESKSEIHDILLKSKSSEKFYKIREFILEEIKENSSDLLLKTQKKFQMKIYRTDWFENENLPNSIDFQEVKKFIFSQNINQDFTQKNQNKKNIGIVEINKNLLFIIRIEDYCSEFVQPIHLVKEKIFKLISFRKAYEKVEKDGKFILDQLRNNQNVNKKTFFSEIGKISFQNEKTISRREIDRSSFLHQAFNMSISNRENPSYCMIRDGNQNLIIIKLTDIIREYPSTKEIELASSEVLRNFNFIVLESLFFNLFSHAKIDQKKMDF
ncbi:SurA N-terminal domain-containing protein [Candidatus Riesia pediculicola]|uniref:SurA N-terminal domain-containing protein n=1 Tax=Candidatus Riesia pediculicola TaxID=401619 RepID=UPI0009B7A622|nr:SurA N-terminal domain-containing protein [Candidatus Riesia pediculicola]ARC53685.1 hypothetical protein AOE55_00740 [Candidatus Riesia pediculicola]